MVVAVGSAMALSVPRSVRQGRAAVDHPQTTTLRGVRAVSRGEVGEITCMEERGWL